MLKQELTKVTSYLYRNDYMNPAREEINEVTKKNPHPKTEIEHEFSPETTNTIDRVLKLVADEEMKREQELKRLKKRKK